MLEAGHFLTKLGSTISRGGPHSSAAATSPWPGTGARPEETSEGFKTLTGRQLGCSLPVHLLRALRGKLA
jgi:hypothetical protein